MKIVTKKKIESKMELMDLNLNIYNPEILLVNKELDVCVLKTYEPTENKEVLLALSAPKIAEKIYTISASQGIFSYQMVPIFDRKI